MTGLDYLRARWLNFEAGRFLSTDPFAGVQEIPLSLHDFIYTHQNPTTHVDPTGMTSLIETSITTGTQVILDSLKSQFGRPGAKQALQFGVIFLVETTIWRVSFKLKNDGLAQIAGFGPSLGLRDSFGEGEARYALGNEGILFGTQVIEATLEVVDIAFLAKEVTEFALADSTSFIEDATQLITFITDAVSLLED